MDWQWQMRERERFIKPTNCGNTLICGPLFPSSTLSTTIVLSSSRFDLYDLGVSKWGSQFQMIGSSLNVCVFVFSQNVVLESIYPLQKVDFKTARMLVMYTSWSAHISRDNYDVLITSRSYHVCTTFHQSMYLWV